MKEVIPDNIKKSEGKQPLKRDFSREQRIKLIE